MATKPAKPDKKKPPKGRATKPAKPDKVEPEVLTDEDVKMNVRRDWENNQKIISEAFYKVAVNKQKLPTLVELSKETGLCVKTIDRHLKNPSFKDTVSKLRAVQDKMMMNFMGKVSTSPNPKMWELWWQLTEPEFKPKVGVDHTNNGGKFETPLVADFSKVSKEDLVALIKLKKKLQS